MLLAIQPLTVFSAPTHLFCLLILSSEIVLARQCLFIRYQGPNPHLWHLNILRTLFFFLNSLFPWLQQHSRHFVLLMALWRVHLGFFCRCFFFTSHLLQAFSVCPQPSFPLILHTLGTYTIFFNVMAASYIFRSIYICTDKSSTLSHCLSIRNMKFGCCCLMDCFLLGLL